MNHLLLWRGCSDAELHEALLTAIPGRQQREKLLQNAAGGFQKWGTSNSFTFWVCWVGFSSIYIIQHFFVAFMEPPTWFRCFSGLQLGNKKPPWRQGAGPCPHFPPWRHFRRAAQRRRCWRTLDHAWAMAAAWRQPPKDMMNMEIIGKIPQDDDLPWFSRWETELSARVWLLPTGSLKCSLIGGARDLSKNSWLVIKPAS